jgi:hypothetical protein
MDELQFFQLTEEEEEDEDDVIRRQPPEKVSYKVAIEIVSRSIGRLYWRL